MSEQAVYGFRKNGVDKLSYVIHYGSVDELGEDIVDFISQFDIPSLNNFCDSIQMVDENTAVLDKNREILHDYYAQAIITGEEINNPLDCSNFVWWGYALSCFEGDLSKAYHLYEDSGVSFLIDSGDYIKSSEFCDHGYIINLDINALEYWQGNQTEPDLKNRYGHEISSRGFGEYPIQYYPCKLRALFALNGIMDGSNSVENTVNQMLRINGKKKRSVDNMTAYEPNGHIDQILMDHINEYFGVSVSRYDFPVVFDIYDSEEEFNANMYDGSDNNTFEKLQASGNVAIIDDFYVYFAEGNYNDIMNGNDPFD